MNHNGHCRLFWNECTHLLRLIGGKHPEISPIPLTTPYLHMKSSTKEDSILIYEMNKVFHGSVFNIQFISETSPPYVLEIIMRQNAVMVEEEDDAGFTLGETNKKELIITKPYRIDSILLKSLFIESCVEGRSTTVSKAYGIDDVEVDTVTVLNPRAFFQSLGDDILLDMDSHSMLINSIEAERLKLFAAGSITKATDEQLEVSVICIYVSILHMMDLSANGVIL